MGLKTLTAIGETGDGFIYGNDAVYATARSTDTASNSGIGYVIVGQRLDGGDYRVNRAYFSFDTSSIPDNASIVSATLYFKSSGDGSTTDFLVQVYRYAWAETIAANRAANYDGAYGVGATLEGTLRDTADGFVLDTWYNLAVDLDGINKSGDTKYTVVSNLDVAGTAPADEERVFIYDASAAVGSQPYLVVTYYAWTPIALTPTPQLTMMLFDQDLTSPQLVEQHLESRMVGVKFSTKLPGGFASLSASLPATRQEGMAWVFDRGLMRLVVTEGDLVVWEGRLEDIKYRAGQVVLVAMGYWASLWDEDFYDETTYMTDSYTVDAVIKAILTANCPSINSDQTHIDESDVDVVAWRADGRQKAGAMIQQLVNTASATAQWYGAVWEDRKFWLFPKDRTTVHWRPYWGDIDEPELGWSVDGLVNRARVRYEVDGVSVDTAQSSDASSYARFKIYRDSWPSAGEISAAAATAMRDMILAEQYVMNSIGRLTVRDMIRDSAGTWAPVWRVRAGQVAYVSDLIPGYDNLDTAEDLRKLYVVETEYDVTSGVLTLTPETKEKRV